MLLDDIEVTLSMFESGEQRFRNDVNLSPVGKQKALDGLRAEREQFRAVALRELTDEWSGVRARFHRFEQELAKAEQEESERWNYDKLAYERQVLEDRIQKATPEEQRVLFERVSSSGNVESRRALYELVAVHSRDGKLKEAAKSGLAALRETPEIKAAQELGSQVTARAVKVAKVTEHARRLYDGEPGAFSVSEFDKLDAGIHITFTTDAQTWNTYAHLEVTDAQESALA